MRPGGDPGLSRPPASGGRAARAGGHGRPPILDQAFDAGTLYALRAAVHLHACRAGMSEGQATDVVLAVHELAANAIRHGAGSGRLRVWQLAETLRCQVDDSGPPAGGAPAGPGADPPRHPPTLTDPWPQLPGHGLWVARQVADRMEVLSGPHGTRATVAFTVSRAAGAGAASRGTDG